MHDGIRPALFPATVLFGHRTGHNGMRQKKKTGNKSTDQAFFHDYKKIFAKVVKISRKLKVEKLQSFGL
jgi:hypothetical protein